MIPTAILAIIINVGQLAPARVTIVRTGDSFEATYALPRDAVTWGFFRTGAASDGKQPWRLRSWTVLTPGVRLVHRGRYDALVATRAGATVPRTVRVRVTPFTRDLVSDYVPALRLGRDGVALFDGHFSIFPLSPPNRLETLPLDLSGTAYRTMSTRVSFTGQSGHVRLAGDIDGYAKGDSEGTYGLFDVPAAVNANGMATVVDPQLPARLADDIRDFTPRVLDRYASLLGGSGAVRPTVLASWAGSDLPGASLNGGVLKGLVLLRISGQSALGDNPRLRTFARAFIAHESAHFWLGQSIDVRRRDDRWIIEGGADLLAFRAAAALTPPFDATAQLQGSLDRCLVSSAKGPLGDAGEDDETAAWYACGAILSRVAERAARDDFPAFYRRLAAAAGPDHKIDAAIWLATLDRYRPGLSSRIRVLLARAQPTPANWIALLEAAAVPLRRRPDGTPELLP